MEKSDVKEIAQRVRNREYRPEIGADERQRTILPTVPCELCERLTFSIGTKRCDSCWELERLVIEYPSVTKRILRRIGEL